MPLMQAIIAGNSAKVAEILSASPSLARQAIVKGATRQEASEFFFPEIAHYMYAGDTPLHAAAAAYRVDIAKELMKHGADVFARNRRGAQPLHYAADGGPEGPHWNPQAQAEMITFLISVGANPHLRDKSGVAPIHRAVRGRCPSAVQALLQGDADVSFRNNNGSTPLHLAVQNTGRGGSGSPESKACQREIIKILLAAGASLNAKNNEGKTVRQSIQGDWLHALIDVRDD